jgi:ferric-dicitrate binding protein FerR (iron transport regulator)
MEKDKNVIEKLDQVFSGFPNTDAPPEAIGKFRKCYRQQGLTSLKTSSFATIFRRVAAILIIPMISLVVYQYFSNKQIQTPVIVALDEYSESIIQYVVNPGVKGKVVLPDGSTVWLNSSSSLIVPAVFDDHARIVKLNGEAFFDVHSDEDRPMYVKTNKNITVKVTGTQFNISTYTNDGAFRLHLISGNVQLVNESSNEELNVLPNQEIFVRSAEQQFRQAGNPNKHLNTAWKEGYLVFDGTQISEVIRKMERWYGVNIEVHSTAILNEKFTAEFKSESLTQVLDLLNKTSGIKYVITDDGVILRH